MSSFTGLPLTAPVTVTRRRRHRIRRLIRSNRLTEISAIILGVIVIVAIAAPWLAPHDPAKQDLFNKLASPSREHWLGTDLLGRDVFSRLLFGARTSLLAGAEAVAVALLLGVPAGLIAGYTGGLGDRVPTLINNSLMSVPGLLLALAVVAAVGPGLTNTMLAVGLVMMPRLFRLTRAAARDVRNERFIEASVGVGCTRSRVLWCHVLPNTLPPIIVQVSFLFGTAIIAEASLSYLGLGVRPPTASWGSMLSEAAQKLEKTHLLIGPGVMLTITVLALASLGDGIRDAMGLQRERSTDDEATL